MASENLAVNKKKMVGFSFFALWFGAAISLGEIVTGSYIAPLGMKKGIIAILLGHLIGCIILGLVGYIGFQEKKPTLVCSRRSFGIQGSYIISAFNILQLVGWTAMMLIWCTQSLQPVLLKLFGFNNFSIITLAIGILVALWALSTDKGIHIINNLAVVLLGGLCVMLLNIILKDSQPMPVVGNISFGGALELSIIMSLSWVPLIADYTMSGRSSKASVGGSFLGYFIGSSFMFITGLTIAIYSGNKDPISMLSNMNMGISAVLIVVLATVTTTFLDVYSTVMSTLNINEKLSKRNLIIIYSAVGIGLALFFPEGKYESFLVLIGSLFAPAFSVVLFDYFILKRDFSQTRINILGIGSALAGSIIYYNISKIDMLFGSTLPTMLATITIYVVLIIAKKFVNKRRIQYAK